MEKNLLKKNCAEIFERLLLALKTRKESDLADFLGVSRQSISNAKKRAIPQSWIFDVAGKTGVSIDWLLSGESPLPVNVSGINTTGNQSSVSHEFIPVITWDKPEELPDGEYIFVPRYDIRVSAGNGCTVESEMIKDRPQAFRSDWAMRKRLSGNLACVTAKGDSMEPIISDGDTMLLDRGNIEIQDGKVYVLRYGDEIRVKRLSKRYDGGIVVRSENRDCYPDEIIPAEAMGGQVEIIGRVVWTGGEI